MSGKPAARQGDMTRRERSSEVHFLGDAANLLI